VIACRGIGHQSKNDGFFHQRHIRCITLRRRLVKPGEQALEARQRRFRVNARRTLRQASNDGGREAGEHSQALGGAHGAVAVVPAEELVGAVAMYSGFCPMRSRATNNDFSSSSQTLAIDDFRILRYVSSRPARDGRCARSCATAPGRRRDASSPNHHACKPAHGAILEYAVVCFAKPKDSKKRQGRQGEEDKKEVFIHECTRMDTNETRMELFVFIRVHSWIALSRFDLGVLALRSRLSDRVGCPRLPAS
jgi:hypothetical protein